MQSEQGAGYRELAVRTERIDLQADRRMRLRLAAWPAHRPPFDSQQARAFQRGGACKLVQPFGDAANLHEQVAEPGDADARAFAIGCIRVHANRDAVRALAPLKQTGCALKATLIAPDCRREL